MSKLIVEVVKIKSIIKHPNADKLSIAAMESNDYNCIIGLDQYKAGDLVVFCPIDSIIPEDIIEKYKLEYLKGHGRVRTVKLRKCISQGLILDIPKPMGSSWKEGLDVAIMLGIKKYEVKSPSYQTHNNKPTRRKMNPAFDKYTDIDNIKNYKQIFKEGEIVVITEKIHGSNWRIANLPRYKGNLWGRIKSFLFGKYELVYGSHNVQLKSSTASQNFYGEDVYGRMAKKYNFKDFLQEDFIVYGEIYGKGIQDLTYGLDDIDLVIFDVKYKGRYLDYAGLSSFCLLYNLPMVPVLYIGEYSDKIKEECTETKLNITQDTVFGLEIETVSGKSELAIKNGMNNQVREGCVIKPVKEENNYRIGRKILKSINSVYLLRKGGTEFK